MESRIDELRQLIERALDARDWSVRRASLRAHLSESTLKNFLSGKRRGMDSETARKIASVFEWPEDYVLALAGHRSAEARNQEIRSALRQAMGTDRWGTNVLQALLTLAEETDRQSLVERFAIALEEVLAEPMAAHRGQMDGDDYARLVLRRTCERVFGVAASQGGSS